MSIPSSIRLVACATLLATQATSVALAGDFLLLDTTDGSPTRGHLLDVVAASGVLTDLGPIAGAPLHSPPTSYGLADIERGPDGTLYGVAPAGVFGGFNVYVIDELTLSASQLGGVSGSGAGNLAIAIHPTTNHVWVAAESGLTFSFWELDTAAPAAWYRGAIPGSAKWGLAFDALGNLYHLRQPNDSSDLELLLVDQLDASQSTNLGGIPGLDFTFYQKGVHLASDTQSGSLHVSSNEYGEIRALDPTGPTATPAATLVGPPQFFGFAEGGGVDIYGCGLNPPGSLSVLSGTPQVGKTLTLGVDNPLGTQFPGSLSFVFLATLPSPAYPCGTALPGMGMGGGPGELLIDVLPPNPILPALQGAAWAGPGMPAPVPLAFPQNPGLVGKRIYAQGVLIDLSFVTIPVALAEAAEIVIGG